MQKLLPASRVSLGRILPAKCESCFHKSKSSQAPYSRDGHRSKGAWSRLPQAGEHSIATHVETLERCRQAASQPARCISPHCPADWLGHRYIRFATLQAPGVLVPCRGTTSPTRKPAQCLCSQGTWQASGKKSSPYRGPHCRAGQPVAQTHRRTTRAEISRHYSDMFG